MVTTDPIRRLELRYSLVQFYENKKELEAAQRNMDALYRENPKILGVVRSTVDFYWRNKGAAEVRSMFCSRRPMILIPRSATQFSLRRRGKRPSGAIRACPQTVEPTSCRRLRTTGEYLAAMADTYARAGDDQGLKKFYLEKIDVFRKASLSQDDRNADRDAYGAD